MSSRVRMVRTTVTPSTIGSRAEISTTAGARRPISSSARAPSTATLTPTPWSARAESNSVSATASATNSVGLSGDGGRPDDGGRLDGDDSGGRRGSGGANSSLERRCSGATGSSSDGCTRRIRVIAMGPGWLGVKRGPAQPKRPVMYSSVRFSVGLEKIFSVLSISTIRPGSPVLSRVKNAVVSLTRAACCMLWVTMTIV